MKRCLCRPMWRVFVTIFAITCSVHARAQTESQIRAKIDRLEAEIGALKRKLPQGGPEVAAITASKTRDGAILCLSPASIKDAYQAAIAADTSWLKSLNCVSARGGIPITVLERNSLG